MVEMATVLESSVGPNRDQESPVRLIKASLATPEDVQTLQLAGGMDHSPVPGAQMLVLEIGESWKIATPLNDGTTPSAATGEKYLYSQNTAGAIQAIIKLKSDGIMELNGNTDFAVAFTDLNTAIELLKTQVTTMVSAVNAAIPSGVSVPVLPPLTAEISAAKVDTVKLP